MSRSPSSFVAGTEWRQLGCLVRVVVTDAAYVADAREILKRTLDDLDLACSRFRDDSEIARLDVAAGRWITASPLLVTAIAAAIDAAEETDGDLDPTLGRSMESIGYDRDFEQVGNSVVPITIVRPGHERWRDIEIDLLTTSVKVPADVRLDLGATAKALGADLAAVAIASQLGCGVLVALGGDISTAGEAPAEGWPIRVQDVTTRVVEPAPEASQTVTIDGGGLATSSLQARRWIRGDRQIHHILDPRSGAPVSTPWRTVSVAAGSCLAANVASTAAIIKGHCAPEWLAGRGMVARLISHDGEIVTTPGWPS